MLGGFIFIVFEYVLFYIFNINLWETKRFFFTIAMQCNYAWVIFVFKDSFKS